MRLLVFSDLHCDHAAAEEIVRQSRDVDVVIGCLDNREARLWVNRSCWKVNTPWIDGGIQEISGVARCLCRLTAPATNVP